MKAVKRPGRNEPANAAYLSAVAEPKDCLAHRLAVYLILSIFCRDRKIQDDPSPAEGGT
jgi:hypothetical protein